MFFAILSDRGQVSIFGVPLLQLLHSSGARRHSAHEHLHIALVPCVEAEGNRAFLWKDAGKDNLTSMPMVSGEILHKFP